MDIFAFQKADFAFNQVVFNINILFNQSDQCHCNIPRTFSQYRDLAFYPSIHYIFYVFKLMSPAIIMWLVIGQRKMPLL